MMKNTIKILSFLAVLGTLIFATSCSSDDVADILDIDETNPTITVNAPADGSIVVAGSQVQSSISFSDDTEISSISITVGNGTVTVIDVEETEIGAATFSFTDNLAIPANVVLGEHTVTVTVTDASGNSAEATLTLDAYPVYTDGQTTVLVTSVPDQVTDYSGADAIRMVGSHQESAWSVDSDSHPLTAYTDSEGDVTFYQQIANTGSEFKFVRGLAWEMVEKDENGAELVGNRAAEADATKVEFEIGSWRDYNPEVSNNSGASIISIDGTLTSDVHTLSGTITPAITTSSAISSASYSILDSEDNEASSGSLTLDVDGNFSQEISLSGLDLDSYTVVVSATDAAGNSGREDESLNLVEFPCDDSGETAVSATMTRIIINVPTISDDIYVTGKIGGVDMWGFSADGGTVGDATYQLTQLSDGCYYIDLALAADDILQFVRSNAGYADWWRGQATNTEGSDATASHNISAASDGSTDKLFYGFWREEPTN